MKKLLLLLALTFVLSACSTPSVEEQVETEPEVEFQAETSEIEGTEVIEFTQRSLEGPDVYVWNIEDNFLQIHVLSADRQGAMFLHHKIKLASPHYGYLGGDPQIDSNELFFLSKFQLYALNLESGELRDTGIQAEDFLISENSILFLSGGCSEGGNCALSSYNRTMGETDTLAEDLFNKVERMYAPTFNIHSFNVMNGEVQLSLSSADGGGAGIVIYKVPKDLESNLELIDSGGTYIGECNPDDMEAFDTTLEECESNLQKYTVYTSKPAILCGGNTYAQTEEGVVETLASTGNKWLLEDVKLISCVD